MRARSVSRHRFMSVLTCVFIDRFILSLSLSLSAADIPTCRASDANISECIKQGFQQLTPRLREGISDLNVPPMDPLQMGKSSYSYNAGILQGRIAMRDVQIHGLSEGIVDKVGFRQKNNRVRLEIASHHPQMLAEGSYKADIKLNDMKLTPKGNFNITLRKFCKVMPNLTTSL